jgi:hypothetical protein
MRSETDEKSVVETGKDLCLVQCIDWILNASFAGELSQKKKCEQETERQRQTYRNNWLDPNEKPSEGTL